MGGIGAQGDLAGGAGLVDDGAVFSLLGPLAERVAVLDCRSALAPSLRTVGFGPIDVTGFAMYFGVSLAAGICSTGGNGSCVSAVLIAIGCEAVRAGAGWGCSLFRSVLVPSFHSMVSGAQPSSSSSISAHFDSVPPPSSCILEVM